jgi:hypothetical protein
MTGTDDHASDDGKDYIVCGCCGFVGAVPRGTTRCPECNDALLYPMTEDERRGFDAGTYTHFESCAEDLMGYTGSYSAARQAALRKEE